MHNNDINEKTMSERGDGALQLRFLNSAERNLAGHDNEQAAVIKQPIRTQRWLHRQSHFSGTTRRLIMIEQSPCQDWL